MQLNACLVQRNRQVRFTAESGHVECNYGCLRELSSDAATSLSFLFTCFGAFGSGGFSGFAAQRPHGRLYSGLSGGRCRFGRRFYSNPLHAGST